MGVRPPAIRSPAETQVPIQEQREIQENLLLEDNLYLPRSAAQEHICKQCENMFKDKNLSSQILHKKRLNYVISICGTDSVLLVRKHFAFPPV